MTSGGHLVQRSAHSRAEAMQDSPPLLRKPSGILIFYPESQNLMMVSRGERKIAWLGNIVSDGVLKDGISIAMNTSLSLLENLSLDIGSEMVLMHY